MGMRRLILTVAFLVSAPHVCAWDPFGIFKSASDRAAEAGSKLIGKAKEAFDESIKELFDDDINPLIDKVNAMAMEDLGVLKKDIEEVVADATKHIEDLIDHAADVAQHFVDKTIDEIKEKIIDETAQKVQDVESMFFQGLNGFLQKFYEVVSKINCMAQGDIDKVYTDIYKLLAGKGCLVLPDKCCREGGVAFKKLTEMGDTQLYALEVCRRTSGLDGRTPVEEVKKAYVDCQIAAKKFYCTNFGTGTAKDYFTKEYNKWGVMYDSWAHPLATKTPTVASRLTATKDDGCTTPVECYQKAIAKLNEARAEIQGKADMAVVKPLIDERAEELKIFHGDQCPDGWVEAEATRGYMLVSRPGTAKTGTKLNTPLKDGETVRVAPHSHKVKVGDAGHDHGVNDPGHGHSIAHGAQWDGYAAGGVWTRDGDYASIASATTGVSVASNTCGINVEVAESEGEGYPMTYVLLCQRVQSSEAMITV